MENVRPLAGAFGATYPGETIKEDDSVRLSWAFKDQTTGFRDFTDDLYGRRHNQVPPDLEDEMLFLNLPWPRFESIKAPIAPGNGIGSNAMVMSTESSEEVSGMQIQNLPQLANDSVRNSYYALQDVSFRIDTVANNGCGDTDDYLIPTTEEVLARLPMEEI